LSCKKAYPNFQLELVVYARHEHELMG
jgi:hypothetical protein